MSLSEQQLVDCDYNEDNQGCNGGLMEKAFDYIVKNGGLTNETDYPYAGQNGQCATAKEKNYAASINGYETVPIKNETALKVAVSMQPVSVAIDAGGLLFQLYDGGIFSGFCGTRLNHGVAAVGYGEEEGRKYWIVKNSWGTEWGEDGYIRMERGIIDKTGKCGIALEPSYPVKNA